MKTMIFENALLALKEGQIVKRLGWSGSKAVQIQFPDGNSKMNEPYIFMTIQPEDEGKKMIVVPWVASHGDLLGNDWVLL